MVDSTRIAALWLPQGEGSLCIVGNATLLLRCAGFTLLTGPPLR